MTTTPASELPLQPGTHRLGPVSVSALGLGCMGLSEFRGQIDPQDAISTVRTAIDCGVTLLDTADLYGDGDNERIVGLAVRGVRDSVLLSTKCGLVRSAKTTGRRVCGRPEYIRQACDRSLIRMGVDHVDFLFQHRIDSDVPVEETVGALGELVGAGKVSHIGLSEVNIDLLRRAMTVHPIAAVQEEWSLLARDIERDLIPECVRLGVGVVAYSPLARGLLSGTIRSARDIRGKGDARRDHPRFTGTNLQHNVRVVNRFRLIAERLQISVAQLALAWLRTQGDFVVAIPGAQTPAQVYENVAAAAMKIDGHIMHEIDDACLIQAIRGERLDVGRARQARGTQHFVSSSQEPHTEGSTRPHS